MSAWSARVPDDLYDRTVVRAPDADAIVPARSVCTPALPHSRRRASL